MSGPFDELEQGHAAREEAVERFDRDMREAVRLLMTRREGRTFITWLLEGQDPRAIMRRVMEYVEGISV